MPIILLIRWPTRTFESPRHSVRLANSGLRVDSGVLVASPLPFAFNLHGLDPCNPCHTWLDFFIKKELTTDGTHTTDMAVLICISGFVMPLGLIPYNTTSDWDCKRE
jgi:hypothetical protein